MSNNNFLAMIAAFEQAAALIEQGNVRKARSLITELPEPIYEKSLRWYSSKVKDYYYYLIRYVLDSFEFKVMYCHKPGLQQDLILYLDMIHSLHCNKPCAVLDDRKAVIANLDILSTPFTPIKQPKGPGKPTPLFN